MSASQTVELREIIAHKDGEIASLKEQNATLLRIIVEHIQIDRNSPPPYAALEADQYAGLTNASRKSRIQLETDDHRFRHPSDRALIARAMGMFDRGEVTSFNKAAQILAPEADGTSDEQKIKRLRTLFSKEFHKSGRKWPFEAAKMGQLSAIFSSDLDCT